MSTPSPSPEALARVAACALGYVKPSMRLGLGTGRAAEAFIVALGAAVRGGLEVVGVPTSDRSHALAEKEGIRVVSLGEATPLDIAFDGADEVTANGSLTKGLGGAMLRERVVAFEAKRFVVLVTPEKRVSNLGARCALPIEVTPFALATALLHLAKLGAPVVRKDSKTGADYRTDNGNAVVDLEATDGGWADARATDVAVRAIPGVVDTGFFFDLASDILIGEDERVIELGPFRLPG